MSTTARFVSGLRGGRYAEVFLARVDGENLVAEVFNSFGLNEAPQDLWDALDPQVIAAEHQVDLAIKNGPRYWLMDRIEKRPVNDRRIVDFGGIEMFCAATIELPLAELGQRTYRPRPVDRRTIFAFAAGSQIFELLDPTGKVYVMQAYCVAVDPSLDEAALAELGSRLDLPEGWSYRTRILEADLEIDTREVVAQVLQDEFENSYCLASN